MALPNINGTFRLVKAPRLAGINGADGSSTHVLSMRVAASRSKCNPATREWEDVARVFVDVDYYRDNAHVLAGKLDKGTQVYVSGELVTDEWNDKTTGERRSKIKVRASQVHPLVTLPTVVPFNRNDSTPTPGTVTPNTGHPTGTAPRSTPHNGDTDPWAPPTGEQTTLNTGNDEPPF